MTFAEIEDLSRHFLDEEKVDYSHWKPARLQGFINTARIVIAKRLSAPLLPELQADDTQNLQANTAEYDLPDDFLGIVSVRIAYEQDTGVNVFVPARPIGIDETGTLETMIFYTPTETRPFFSIWGKKITIYPTPEVGVQLALTVRHIKTPAMLVDPTDVPDLPEWTHYYMAVYAAKMGQDEDGQDSSRLTAMFDAAIPEPKEPK